MITPQQIQTVKIAQRRVGLSDAEYRLVLKNVARATSSKELDNAGFETVMAFMEERGFQMHGRPADYFRNKLKLRGTFAGDRVVFKIRELIAGTKYAAGLPGLCERFSHGRTREVTKLNPSEAHALVEMLKAVGGRQSAEGGEEQPALFSVQRSTFSVSPAPSPQPPANGVAYLADEPF